MLQADKADQWVICLGSQQATTDIINAHNRPLQHARAHQLLNAEVLHTLLHFQAEQRPPNVHCWTWICGFSLAFTNFLHLFNAEIKRWMCRLCRGLSCKAGFYFILFYFHMCSSVHVRMNNPCECFPLLGRSHQLASSPSSITIIIALHLLPFHISKPTSVPLFPHPFALFPLLSSAQTSRDG